MRVTPVSLLAAAFLVTGCASNSPQVDADLGPLADQADRVAQLIDQERPCEAVEAARTLGSLADDERFSEPVTQAVTSFATSAEASIECPPATTERATTEPPPPPPDNDADDEDDADNADNADNEDDKNDKDEDPGEGKAKGKNGNPGRGNGDD